jgi:hypothetical protein
MKKTYKAFGGKILPTDTYSNTRVIIYNDDDIQYIIGNGTSFEWEPRCLDYECINGTRHHIPLNAVVTMSVDDAECLENIKLDDTLMKRIAKFNKEQECKRLDKEIEDKKKEIEKIEEVLEDRNGRLKKLKTFIRDIYEIDIDEDDWNE